MSKEKTTKILAVSDIHGDSSLAKKLAKRAEEEKWAERELEKRLSDKEKKKK